MSGRWVILLLAAACAVSAADKKAADKENAKKAAAQPALKPTSAPKGKMATPSPYRFRRKLAPPSSSMGKEAAAAKETVVQQNVAALAAAQEAKRREEERLAEVRQQVSVGLWKPDHIVDDEGNTLLHDAVRRGYGTVVDYLLRQGANPTARDRAGYTPLDFVRGMNRPDIEKQLRDAVARRAVTPSETNR